MKRYYSLFKWGTTADVYIYGDITSCPYLEGDVSSFNLSKQLQELEDVDQINVYIKSYGGEVAEGLTIYNSLKRHNAKITTIVDGFACSIASVIFVAGDERIIYDTSLLMIHNAWIGNMDGNAKELRKQADDLDIVNQTSVNAYTKVVNITEEELIKLMDDESWISGNEALQMGFATKIVNEEETQAATQGVRNKLFQRVRKKSKAANSREDEKSKPIDMIRALINLGL